MALIPTQATLTVGGRTFTDLSNLIILKCYVDSVNAYSIARRPNSSSGYTPSGGNSFRVLGIKIYGAIAGYTFISYSDVDVGFSSTTPFTNPVYPGASIVDGGTLSYNSNDAVTSAERDFDFTVVNGKFLGISSSASKCQIDIYGYEVP